MTENLVQIIPTSEQIELINQALVGFWSNDIWLLEECPLTVLNASEIKHKKCNFSKLENTYLRQEVKYYLYHHLTKGIQSVKSCWSAFSKYAILFKFLDIYYPKVTSILDIPQHAFILKYQSYLVSIGKPIELSYEIKSKPWLNQTKRMSPYMAMYHQLYNFYLTFYDLRDETEKDRWDVRKLNIKYNMTTAHYFLDFSKIAPTFRDLVKRYVKSRLLIQQTICVENTASYISKLSFFFDFLNERHPEWENLKNLCRSCIEEFILYIRKTPMGGNRKSGKSPPSECHINRTLLFVQSFLSYIQKYDWEEAPVKLVKSLIFPEDHLERKKICEENIKYIPDDIWIQVLNNISQLSQEYIPIILLMEASGFRVSDVLSLKINCLDRRDDGWWLVGDQSKVKYKDHRVPIDEEIAKVVISQQEIIRPVSTLETNPNNYLFPKLSGSRKGKPLYQGTILENLNKLAHKCKIVDLKGNIYWFKNHAFRHRYGVNLINNGMSLVHVQKLMAHASPEMTLVYAKIQDKTLRESWEKARENGAFKLDLSSGQLIETNIEQHAEENGIELEWIRHNLDSIRLDHGFCIKSAKLPCSYLDQTLEPPCIKNNCKSFHVDSTFLPYYKDQITKMESDIEIYKKVGRTRSIEILVPKLNRYKQITGVIEHGDSILGLDKAKREYIGEDRQKVNINVK